MHTSITGKFNIVLAALLSISLLSQTVAYCEEVTEVSALEEANLTSGEGWRAAGIDAIKHTQVPVNPNNASVVINSAEDFINFSKNCHLDTYSKNLTVVLNSDISLEGIEECSIPIFDGIFYGNGHTISNYEYTTNAVNVGLFGIVTENGTIQDLNLEGLIDPSGVSVSVGALASQNNGIIRRCTFSGQVINDDFNKEIEARQAAGGLVGINCESGIVMDCAVTGLVQGLKSTGGIAGENYGDITSSYSNASVNTLVKDENIGLKDLKVKDFGDVKDLVGFKKLYASEETGGIVGLSKGNITKCINSGNVGNYDNGYNVGGIVGKTSGFVYECQNAGIICGKTNVGGIAGLAEPGVVLGYSEEILGDVKSDIDGVFDTVDSTLADINTNVDGISKSLSTTLSTVNDALNTAKELEKVLTDIVNTKITEVDGIKDSANGMIEGVNQLLSAVHEVTLGLQQVSQDATDMTQNINYGLDHLKGAGKGLTLTLAKAITNPPITWKSSEPDDPAALDNFAVHVDSASLAALDGKDIVLLKNGKAVWSQTVNSGTEDYLFYNLPVYSNGMMNVYTCKVQDGGSDVAMYKSGGVDIIVDDDESSPYDVVIFTHEDARFSNNSNVDGTVNWRIEDAPEQEDVRPSSVVITIFSEYTLPMCKVITDPWSFSFTDLPFTYTDSEGDHTINYSIYEGCYDDDTENNPLDEFSKSVEYEVGGDIKIINSYPNNGVSFEINPDSVADIISGVLGSVDGVSSTMGDFINAGTYLHTITQDLTRTMSRVNGIGVPKLEGIPGFSTISDELTVKLNRLTDDISKIVSSVDGINGSLNTTQKDLTNDLRRLTSQANGITDNIFDMVSNIQLSLGKILVDNSENLDLDLGEVYNKGVILKCDNTGIIRAAETAGGVVGIMNITEIPDIEKLTKESEGLTLPQIEYKALLRECQNHGDVTADGDYVGLICGKQQLGAIIGCEAYGGASSVMGWYVGGISGFGHGIIKNCLVKGTISGAYYVGGILGLGAEKELLYPASNVYDNCSLVTIGSVNQFKGAIAGDNIGYFENNYFYSDELNGINDYSVSGQFEPAEYGFINNKFNFDGEYSSTYVLRFIASDTIVKEVMFDYGQSFDESIYPTVPDRTFMIGFWRKKDLNNLVENVDVEAYYLLNPILVLLIIVLIIMICIVGHYIKKFRRTNRRIKYLNEQKKKEIVEEEDRTEEEAEETQKDTSEEAAEENTEENK